MASVVPALAFIDGIGGPELLLVLFIALLLFGGEKLPGLARTMGKTINQLKKASGEVERELKKAMEDNPQPAAKPPLAGAPASSSVAEYAEETAFPPLSETQKALDDGKGSSQNQKSPDGPSNPSSGDAGSSEPPKGNSPA